MILICGAFWGCAMIAFAKTDRFVDAFAGSSCLCGSSEEGSHFSADSNPMELCCDGHDSSSQVPGLFVAHDTIVRMTTVIGAVGFEDSALPEGPYPEQIAPPLIRAVSSRSRIAL